VKHAPPRGPRRHSCTDTRADGESGAPGLRRWQRCGRLASRATSPSPASAVAKPLSRWT
jgi:hypothetical protein